MNKAIFTLLLIFCLPATAVADDLYRVGIFNKNDAEKLSATGVDPLERLTGGYLVLADSESGARLAESGLAYRLVATGVEKDQLALDGRLDLSETLDYPMIFEEDGLQIYLIDFAQLAALPDPPRLIPIGSITPTIDYHEPLTLRTVPPAEMVDLEWLISQINEDSLESYTERMQAFYRRVAGTDSSDACRDWLATKFAAFDYDSVVFDSFETEVYGTMSQCQNVIAYKVGARFPNHHVIVCAHRDAVPNCPGADDNASGCAGLLEIARVLRNIETEMTIIFILFDSEENYITGSTLYAAAAAARGDSIVGVLDLDMLGYRENILQANMHHGPDTTLAILWRSLADSLVGVQGFLAGPRMADHYPFIQKGYDAIWILEYIYSPVYHTSADSTTYLNYSYMAKLVKASLAVAYVLNATAGPPTIEFTYPEDLPTLLTPASPNTFVVALSGAWGGTPEPGTARLHYAVNDAGYISIPMTEISTDSYAAVLPAADCYNRLAFYFSARDNEGRTMYDPDPTDPYTATVTNGAAAVFSDDFETDQGWTVSGDAWDGHWERVIPNGAGFDDPTTDFDGSGYCFLTDDDTLFDSDVDVGTTILDSPLFDLAGSVAEINYARWYSNEGGGEAFNDVFTVFISNDNGATWTTVEIIGPDGPEVVGGWFEFSFWVNDFVAPTDQMRMRFTAADLGIHTHVEAAMDAFSIVGYQCESESDWDSDEILNENDNCPFAANPLQENSDGDEEGDACDVDNDNDGVVNVEDNCEWSANSDQQNTDGDESGDVCDNDDDNDSVPDDTDNCPLTENLGQDDFDGDGLGNACDDCDCTGLGDLNLDDAFNPLDVVFIVNFVYKNLDLREQLPTVCPTANGDWDCDTEVNPLDVVNYVNFVYKSSGSTPCDPCAP